MSEQNKLKPLSPCSCTNMRRASRALTQLYDKLLEPSGLKVTQYSMLSHLGRLGPLTMNEFSAAIRLERTTLVRNLKLLEKAGLVALVAEAHSQARIVMLTEGGQALLAASRPYWVRAQRKVETFFASDELELFQKLLQKMESINLDET